MKEVFGLAQASDPQISPDGPWPVSPRGEKTVKGIVDQAVRVIAAGKIATRGRRGTRAVGPGAFPGARGP
jgi:hypothetical protein